MFFAYIFIDTFLHFYTLLTFLYTFYCILALWRFMYDEIITIYQGKRSIPNNNFLIFRKRDQKSVIRNLLIWRPPMTEFCSLFWLSGFCFDRTFSLIDRTFSLIFPGNFITHLRPQVHLYYADFWIE